MFTWQLHNLHEVFPFPENFQAHARLLAVPYALLVPQYVRKLSYLYRLLPTCYNVRIVYTTAPFTLNFPPSQHVIARKTLLCCHTPVAPSIRRFDEQNGVVWLCKFPARFKFRDLFNIICYCSVIRITLLRSHIHNLCCFCTLPVLALQMRGVIATKFV